MVARRTARIGNDRGRSGGLMPFLVVIGLQVLCIVHLMRTGRNPLWLTALIFLPVVSAIAYLVVEVLPGLGTNRHVRTARAKAIETKIGRAHV